MGIDATERAELEQLRLATRLSGVATWNFELAGGDLASARLAVGTTVWESIGYGRDETPAELGSGLALAVHADDQARVVAGLQACIDGTAEQFEVEFRVRHKDGSVRWKLGRGVAIRDDVGRPLRIAGTSVDVTRLKQVEENARVANERLEVAAQLLMGTRVDVTRLRQAEEDVRAANEQAQRAVQQLRLATDLSGVGLWHYELGEDGDLANATVVFDGISAGLGYDVHKLPQTLPERLVVVVHPDEQARMYVAAQEAIAGVTPMFDVECRLIAPDGSVRWWLIRGIVTRDASGRPVTFMGTAVDIGQLKQTQAELERVKDRLEVAVVGSKAATWDIEMPSDGDFTKARVAYTNIWELLGHDAAPGGADTVDTSFVHTMEPEVRDPLMAEILGFLAGSGCEWEREVRARHESGAPLWLLTRGVVARDATGKPTRFTGTAIDITDRKLTERALQASEERLRGTFKNAAVGMLVTDVDGRFLEANARFCEFLGYAREELLGHKFIEFMHPDEVAEDLARVGRVLRGEIPSFTRDKRYARKSGAVVWGNITISIILRHADGTPAHVMGILQDITERKALEVELERGRRRIELALRGSDIAVYQGDFLDANPTNAQWTYFNMWEPLGFDVAGAPEELEQRKGLAIHPDDEAAVAAQLEAAVQRRSRDWYVEHRVLHHDGSVLWRLSRGTLVFDDAGAITSWVGTEVDITKLKQIEGELQRAREAAESANRAKDEFLANVSHEIRTPMNAILGMTELALDSAPSEHQRQLLSTVRSAARNLLTIINDLLDFSKIVSGKLALDRADFSLRAAVGDTLRALAVRAHRKGLELLCHVRPDVPDALEGDAGRLRQVLMNLVGNAVKFTSRGEVEVDVDVAIEPSSVASVLLIFTVRDTGIGIARDKQAAIFHAFEQEDSSTTRKYGGTGLGLTISARLAHLMDGDITVQSAPGCGSTFRFTARFARSANPDAATVSSDRLANLRVLVVDDNETNRGILLEWLTSWRMQPRAACDAAQALSALASAHSAGAPFSLVLLDARMPDTDGVSLAREIRRRWGAAAPRLILLSSEDNAELSAHAKENGVLAYLLKPVQQSELLEAIWAAMNLELTVPASAGPAGGQPERSRPLRVLVAEDNELNVTLLQKLLSHRGHLAQFARDGRAALELALQGEFDLMLLDLHMPELDGFEVVQAIRDHERGTNQHLRIIALTARSSARDRERCLAAGMDEFLAKPIEAVALWAAMERLVAEWPLATPAPRAVEPGLLDARAILRACGKQADILEALRVVLRQTLPVQMSRIDAALASGNFQGLREAAHQLVATVGAFSTVTAGIASTLEDAAIREDRRSCAALVKRLGSLCDALLDVTETLSIDSLSL
jgi:two-component system, sensor histidine kinase and response regulator